MPCSQAFDDPDWRFSVDWDGARSFLIVDADSTALVGETAAANLGERFPELIAARPLGGRSAILDGVVTVLASDGRPDLAAFGQRIALGPAGGRAAPAVFLATDVLRLDRTSTQGWPLDRRLESLVAFECDADVVQVPDHVTGRGRALAEAAAERDIPYLLARRGEAPYRPGLASPDRLRIALGRQVTCVVVGIERRGDERRRLLLGLYEEGRLAIAGWVAGPRELAVERWLEARVAELVAPAPPAGFGGAGGAVEWLRPQLTATVSHQGGERDGTLRRLTLLAVRDDVDPGWCVRREPAPPPRPTARRGGFVPLVLEPLPLGEATTIRH